MKVILILYFLSFILHADEVSLNTALSQFKSEQSVFGKHILDKNIIRHQNKKTINILSFKDQDTRYDLEVTRPVRLDEYIKRSKNSAALLFKNYTEEPVPYQGEITISAVCPKEFLPVRIIEKIDNKTLTIIKHYTGSSYNYRICDRKLIQNSTCTSYFHNVSRSLYYQLKISVKTDSDCANLTKSFFQNLK